MIHDLGVQKQIETFFADLDALERRYPVIGSPRRTQRLNRFLNEVDGVLDEVDFDSLDAPARVDWHLLRREVGKVRDECLREQGQYAALAELTPAVQAVVDHIEARRDHQEPDVRGAAQALADLAAIPPAPDSVGPVAAVLVQQIDALLERMDEWRTFLEGYDPAAGWWMQVPGDQAKAALEKLREPLKERSEKGELMGEQVGREALQQALAREYIAASPERLIEIAQAELEWCDEQLLAASREMGHGDDTAGAVEAVKGSAVEPGGQPGLIRDLALEAIDYVRRHDLVTVPALAEETWRMGMMSRERQKTSPYFLGGEQILVSYPTRDMDHDEKRMSMRGNNPHFSRATVQHELIPGHHLQGFMQQRARPYRRRCWDPFWIEGWTMHWEFLLWERGWPRGPEDRIGMLFWRMHRCARVVCSLRFHLGEMDAAAWSAFLVERVGHEPSHADAEVRRSIGGLYEPLYQVAYLIGGMQTHMLMREMVDGRGWSVKRFHDRMLGENTLPIELLALALREGPIPKEIDPEDPLLDRWVSG